jgi:hypothetical protein
VVSKNLELSNVYSHLYDILPSLPSHEAHQIIFRCTNSIVCEVMGRLEWSHNCDKLYKFSDIRKFTSFLIKLVSLQKEERLYF